MEGVLAMFSPEITWTLPGPAELAGTYTGRDGTGAFFMKLTEYWDRQEVRPLEALGEGNRVVVLGEHRITRKGKEYRVPFAHAWTVEDGLATSFYEYTDTDEFRRIIAS